MLSLRNRHFLVVDLLSFAFSAYLAFALRLDHLNLATYWNGYVVFTVLVIAITIPVFLATRIYSHYWRYASVDELLLLLGSITLATLGVAALSLLVNILFPAFSIPRTVPLIYLPFTVGFVIASRAVVRIHAQLRGRGNLKGTKPVLIMGAGSAGVTIMREIRTNATVGLDVIGFVDDDEAKQQRRIAGVPVRGTRQDIPRLVREYNIKEVIIAMPTAPGTVIREVVALCELADVRARTIPGMGQLINGAASVNLLRDVEIEDLLRRELVHIDIKEIRTLLNGKRILVTGGGGSIGSELCRQIAQSHPAHLLLIGHGENSIFAISNELKRLFPTVALDYRIADVRDRAHLSVLFDQFQPQVVFHAAAHKHVPLMEANPSEAVTNNVLGTKHLVELAAEHGVSHFVLLSTDKAVNPCNVMGASKRCAELLVLHTASRVGRPYVVVRFGNVLGSRGSVLPLFKQQIAAGGPITVTHPDMQRYFMTIPEAVQLVLQAATLGREQEVFVLDMGTPVRIQDMARDLIELSGLRPDDDIEIVFTGVKPGEKLHEELFVPGEDYTRTRHDKIFVAQNSSNQVLERDRLQLIDHLIEEAQRRNDAAIRPLLQRLIPEYDPATTTRPAPGPSQQKRAGATSNGSTQPIGHRATDRGGGRGLELAKRHRLEEAPRS